MSIDIRRVILERLEELGRTRSWLARHKRMDCHFTTVFRYLRRQSEINTDALARIMDILGLEISRPKARPRKKK